MSVLATFRLSDGVLEGEGARAEALAASEDGVCLQVGQGGGRLRFAGPAAGADPWPGDGVLAVDVRHSMPMTLAVTFAFGEGDGPARLSVNAAVLPNVRTRVFFPLSALNAETLFLPRTPGRLKMLVMGLLTESEKVAWFSVGIGSLGEPGACEFSNLRLLDGVEEYVPAGKPVVDALGQWTAREWPGKTANTEALRARLRAAATEPETPLVGRTPYGGSAEIRFQPTGFFRTEHDGKRWWMVDPDGGAFFSAGVDCIRPEAECPVSGNEALCTDLPPQEGEFAEAWLDQTRFAWSIANLIRVFGSDWRPAWERLMRKWLVGWGFNTVANWSDLGFARRSGLPYVLPLAAFPTTERTVFRDFPDVFAPEYTAGARRFAAQLAEYRDDPNLIGYFLRNEPQWAFGAFRIAEELLARDPRRAPGCRRALAEFLAARYGGDSAAFAAAWKGVLGSFADAEQCLLAAPEDLSDRAREDLSEFSRRMVDAYVRIPSEACRAVDPNHLNLGMRWAWIASDDLLAGSDACDVFSMNMYQMAPDPATIARAARASGKPVMIGEFHWGALDRGLSSTGLRAVASQADRGRAYRYYVEQGAALPDLIGVHYFQMNDQPLLGRFDGENFQIGLVDVCWQPYTEMVMAARETHARLYDVASGKVAPFADVPAETARVGF